MPIMPGIQFIRSVAQGLPFKLGNPIGIVLHRTEAGYNHLLNSFQSGPKVSHFLIGKKDGQAVQFVDSKHKAAHVGPGANALYIGVEFESIPARSGYKGQDPLVILDDLTPFQINIGRDVIEWICRTHFIPKVGPPSSAAWRKCKGHWRGVLGHANVAEGSFFHTDHGDTLQAKDFIALGVWPAAGNRPKFLY